MLFIIRFFIKSPLGDAFELHVKCAAILITTDVLF